MAVGIEAHLATDDQAVHLVLVDIGVDLPAARVDQHPEGFLAAHPLAGFPVRIDIQP
ncbi:hypothetical protein D3C76_933560 [compost metagenome]